MLDVSVRQAAIGVRIREAREEKRLKQRQLAQQVPGRDGPVDTQTVSRWERGINTPDIETLVVVADVLGKPLGYFLPDETTLTVGLEDRDARQEAVSRDLARAAQAIADAAERLADVTEKLQALIESGRMPQARAQ